MESSEKLTLTDIVFEHRNRDYGAYELRKSYIRNINRAILMGISLFFVLLISPLLYGKLSPKEKVLKGIIIHLEKFPPEKEHQSPEIIRPQDLKTQEQIKTIQYVIPLPTPDNEVVQEVPPPKENEINGAIISDKTQDGVEVTNDNLTLPPSETNKVAILAELKNPDDDAPRLNVEIQPSFAGGMEEMYKFLSKNLSYPSSAQRNNVQGKVYLSFVVEKDGSLSNIQTIKGVGFGCDEEAVRVVKLMPKWNPGRQQENPVRVKFTIPITFQLEN